VGGYGTKTMTMENGGALQPLQKTNLNAPTSLFIFFQWQSNADPMDPSFPHFYIVFIYYCTVLVMNE
jgi:hypothetical protein